MDKILLGMFNILVHNERIMRVNTFKSSDVALDTGAVLDECPDPLTTGTESCDKGRLVKGSFCERNALQDFVANRRLATLVVVVGTVEGFDRVDQLGDGHTGVLERGLQWLVLNCLVHMVFNFRIKELNLYYKQKASIRKSFGWVNQEILSNMGDYSQNINHFFETSKMQVFEFQ